MSRENNKKDNEDLKEINAALFNLGINIGLLLDDLAKAAEKINSLEEEVKDLKEYVKNQDQKNTQPSHPHTPTNIPYNPPYSPPYNPPYSPNYPSQPIWVSPYTTKGTSGSGIIFNGNNAIDKQSYLDAINNGLISSNTAQKLLDFGGSSTEQ